MPSIDLFVQRVNFINFLSIKRSARAGFFNEDVFLHNHATSKHSVTNYNDEELAGTLRQNMVFLLEFSALIFETNNV